MSFSLFDFHPDINKGITDCGFTMPTPIQEKTIPHILKGNDVLGLAQTGTGKTAAFVLPMLQRLERTKGNKPRALIMAPTRELAEQILQNIKTMAGHTTLKSIAVYGGVGKSPQIKAFQRGVDIIVACPGRLLDLADSRAVSLEKIELLVLDEADQMLDRGFLPDIRRIIKQLPPKRQSLVFSATMPSEIKHLAGNTLTAPVKISINNAQPTTSIAHSLFQVEKQERTALLKHLLQTREMETTLVFTRTKHKARSLGRQLANAGYKATSLQGNLSQQQRTKAMEGFRKGSFNIMVATDIAARGIDVSGISHVVNYDIPDTVEAYVHRTGRTGRADRTGQAYTFAGPDDTKMLRAIEKKLGKKMKKELSGPALSSDSGLPTSSKATKARGRSHGKKTGGQTKKGFVWSKSLAMA